jgi:transposase-like protein
MTTDEREINRKRRILEHADVSGNVAKTCRYFGIPRSLFYVWRKAYRQYGNEGLKRKKPVPCTPSAPCGPISLIA